MINNEHKMEKQQKSVFASFPDRQRLPLTRQASFFCVSHSLPAFGSVGMEKWVIFVNVNTSLTRERGEGLTADLK